MEFPSSIATGYTVTDGTRIWKWNGAAWDNYETLGQIVTVFAALEQTVDTSMVVLPDPVSHSWSLINYI